jgi:hypothetical protein
MGAKTLGQISLMVGVWLGWEYPDAVVLVQDKSVTRRIVQGTRYLRTPQPRAASSKVRVVRGMEHPRLLVRGHIGQGHFILNIRNYSSNTNKAVTCTELRYASLRPSFFNGRGFVHWQ